MNKKISILILTLSLGCISSFCFEWLEQFVSFNNQNKTGIKFTNSDSKQTEQRKNKQNSSTKTNSSKATDERFWRAGIEDDNEVKEFYLKFQKAVAEDDKQTIASMVNFPFKVNFPKGEDRKGYTFIINEKSFVKLYDKIFDKRLKSFIANVDVDYNESQKAHIWANYHGIAVGHGVIWIGIFCENNNCENGKNYLKVRTIHGNSNLMYLDYYDTTKNF